MHWLLRWPSVTAILIMILMVAGGLLLPILNAPRCNPAYSRHGNLKQIGLALRLYRLDHEDFLPGRPGCEGLNQLIVGDYLTDRSIYFFHEDKRPRIRMDQLLGEENTSFAYIGAGLNSAHPQREHIPVVISKPWLVPGHLFVAYLDGHVISFDVPAFQSCVEAVSHKSVVSDHVPADIQEILRENAAVVDKGEREASLPVTTP